MSQNGDGPARVKVAVAGVGSCTQALVLGSALYRCQPEHKGLITNTVGAYSPGSVEVVAAFDVDARKVGKSLEEAVYAGENVSPQFKTFAWDQAGMPNPIVHGGPRLDGIGRSYSERVRDFAEASFDQVCEELGRSGAEVLVNAIPVGSDEATQTYAKAALEVGCAFVNAIPVPLARNPLWADRFEQEGLPLIGDDVKSHFGATYLHRLIAQGFHDRGIKLTGSIQANMGGNMDFFSMQDAERLGEKKISKTQSIVDAGADPAALEEGFIGPAGFVPYLNDTKLAFIEMEGEGFAGNPTRVHCRIEILDSPNWAGVIYDAVRWAKWGMDLGIGGVLDDVSAFLMKAPRDGMSDAAALDSIQARAERWSGNAVPELLG